MLLRLPTLGSGLGLLALLVVACIPIELPCYDLPGTPETCPSNGAGEQAQPKFVLRVEGAWLPEAELAGYAPLAIRASLEGEGDGPVLWDFGDGAKGWSGMNEWVKHTYELPGRYTLKAIYSSPSSERRDEPTVELSREVVVLAPPAGRSASVQAEGRLCDLRVVLLGQPKPNEWTDYKVELTVKAKLDAAFVYDEAPYLVQADGNQTLALPQIGRHLWLNAFRWDGYTRTWKVWAKCVADLEADTLSVYVDPLLED